jgi:hypothetical protein
MLILPLSVFTRSTVGRLRAPSNPISPTSSQSSIGSPPLGAVGSRPNSRAHSHSKPPFPFFHPLSPSSPGPCMKRLKKTITSLPVPHMSSSSSDSHDSDSVDSSLGLVLDRSATSSTASMEPMELLEALQRVNADLGKKLVEAERTRQRNSRITRVNWMR